LGVTYWGIFHDMTGHAVSPLGARAAARAACVANVATSAAAADITQNLDRRFKARIALINSD